MSTTTLKSGDELATFAVDLRHLKTRLARMEKSYRTEESLRAHEERFCQAATKLEAVVQTLFDRRMTVDFEGLIRALLTLGARTELTIKRAIEVYCEFYRHLRQAQEDLSAARSKATRTILEDHAVRFGTALRRQRDVLHDLRVAILEVKPGEVFRPDAMVVRDQIATKQANRDNTVAAVHLPGFLFRLDGTDEAIPAEVDVFVAEPQSSSESTDKTTGNGACPSAPETATGTLASSNGKKKQESSPNQHTGHLKGDTDEQEGHAESQAG